MENFLKSILKTIKLNESTISMILGLVVVAVVGAVIVNYFRLKPAELPVSTDKELAENLDAAEKEEFAETPAEELPQFTGELPVTYSVRAGDSLWKIAERYYQTGYGWVEIAQANELENANVIEKEQELVIPQLAKAYPQTVEESEPAIGGAGSTAQFDEPVEEPVTGSSTEITNAISGDSYIVQKGDHLWGIAERAYNDGYKWVDIASENKLANPGLIYAGTELGLPR